jgi:uncharacterized protein YuzE
MKKVRVHYDREGNTLSVWFDDPKKEHVCQETDDVVLIKDRRGRVIGFERLNYLNAKQREKETPVPVQVQMVRSGVKGRQLQVRQVATRRRRTEIRGSAGRFLAANHRPTDTGSAVTIITFRLRSLHLYCLS